MPGGIDYSKWDNLEVSDDDEGDSDAYEEENVEELPQDNHSVGKLTTGIDYSRFDRIDVPEDNAAHTRPRVTRYDAY